MRHRSTSVLSTYRRSCYWRKKSRNFMPKLRPSRRFSRTRWRQCAKVGPALPLSRGKGLWRRHYSDVRFRPEADKQKPAPKRGPLNVGSTLASALARPCRRGATAVRGPRGGIEQALREPRGLRIGLWIDPCEIVARAHDAVEVVSEFYVASEDALVNAQGRPTAFDKNCTKGAVARTLCSTRSRK